MRSVGLAGGAPLTRVLAIGAHSDDLEIGCGGTMLALARANPGLTVDWVVLAAEGARADEALRSAEVLLSDAGACSVEVHDFRDGYLPHTAADVKDAFEDLKARVEPDLVLTHTRDDLHQDHRLVCELTRHTFRNSLLLEYEIPKFEGDLGQPNFFVHADQRLCEQKIGYVTKFFPSQRDKHWFTEDTFWSLMRIRGLESKAPSGHAEAFHCRKLVTA
jgi:LmbE family N-acetylglucosaminyl deacetylase